MTFWRKDQQGSVNSHLCQCTFWQVRGANRIGRGIVGGGSDHKVALALVPNRFHKDIGRTQNNAAMLLELTGIKGSRLFDLDDFRWYSVDWHGRGIFLQEKKLRLHRAAANPRLFHGLGRAAAGDGTYGNPSDYGSGGNTFNGKAR
jgi:hypothetical protein